MCGKDLHRITIVLTLNVPQKEKFAYLPQLAKLFWWRDSGKVTEMQHGCLSSNLVAHLLLNIDGKLKCQSNFQESI